MNLICDGAHTTPGVAVEAKYEGTIAMEAESTRDRRIALVRMRLSTPVVAAISVIDERRLAAPTTGWNTALREMPVGSRWEIVIPYHLGYGSRSAGAIKAFSTLIFDITLLDIH